MRKAKALARIAHHGQRYGSADYFSGHIERVAARVAADPNSTPEHVTVAYLHDIIEDTHVTLDDLFDLGFSAAVCHAVDTLTRKSGSDYFRYIASIAAESSSIAFLVKRHDLAENSSHGHSAKYIRAINIMKGALS